MEDINAQGNFILKEGICLKINEVLYTESVPENITVAYLSKNPNRKELFENVSTLVTKIVDFIKNNDFGTIDTDYLNDSDIFIKGISERIPARFIFNLLNTSFGANLKEPTSKSIIQDYLVNLSSLEFQELKTKSEQYLEGVNALSFDLKSNQKQKEFIATAGQTEFELQDSPTAILAFRNHQVLSFNAMKVVGTKAIYTAGFNYFQDLKQGDFIKIIY